MDQAGLESTHHGISHHSLPITTGTLAAHYTHWSVAQGETQTGYHHGKYYYAYVLCVWWRAVART